MIFHGVLYSKTWKQIKGSSVQIGAFHSQVCEGGGFRDQGMMSSGPWEPSAGRELELLWQQHLDSSGLGAEPDAALGTAPCCTAGTVAPSLAAGTATGGLETLPVGTAGCSSPGIWGFPL